MAFQEQLLGALPEVQLELKGFVFPLPGLSCCRQCGIGAGFLHRTGFYLELIHLNMEFLC